MIVKVREKISLFDHYYLLFHGVDSSSGNAEAIDQKASVNEEQNPHSVHPQKSHGGLAALIADQVLHLPPHAEWRRMLTIQLAADFDDSFLSLPCLGTRFNGGPVGQSRDQRIPCSPVDQASGYERQVPGAPAVMLSPESEMKTGRSEAAIAVRTDSSIEATSPHSRKSSLLAHTSRANARACSSASSRSSRALTMTLAVV